MYYRKAQRVTVITIRDLKQNDCLSQCLKFRNISFKTTYYKFCTVMILKENVFLISTRCCNDYICDIWKTCIVTKHDYHNFSRMFHFACAKRIFHDTIRGNKRDLTFYRVKASLTSKFFIQYPRARSTQWCCSEIAINSD